MTKDCGCGCAESEHEKGGKCKTAGCPCKGFLRDTTTEMVMGAPPGPASLRSLRFDQDPSRPSRDVEVRARTAGDRRSQSEQRVMGARPMR